MVANALFLFLLFLASYTDLKWRKIPNIIPLLIGVVALGDFHFFGVFLALPFFISAVNSPDKVGGGDIKLTASIGVFLGVELGTSAVILGLVSVLAHWCIRHKNYVDLHKISAPLAPYLTFGVCMTYLF